MRSPLIGSSSSAKGCWRSGAAATWRRRCSPSPRRGRSRTSSGRSATIRSCAASSMPCSGGSSTRSRPYTRSSTRSSTSMTETAPDLRDIEAAQARLEGVARVTPVIRSETFSRLTGREVTLKAENLQRTGSFKIRGAFNKISTLGDAERTAGVVAASAGNHGQAVAWAAREAGIAATIFVHAEAPMAKVDATASSGAEVTMVGASFEAAVAAARSHVESGGATFVHAFEDEVVIAGQGTIGLELAEQIPGPGTVPGPGG